MSLRPALVAGLVFLPFIAYALMVPPTYEGQARVTFAGSRSVDVTYQDSDPEKARAGATALAERTVRVAVRTSTTRPPPALADRAASDVGAFVVARPELLAPPASAEPAPKPRVDPQANLELERARLRRDLERAQNQAAAAADSQTDNPYAERTTNLGAEQLKRRLVEIDIQLQRLRDAPPAVPTVSSNVSYDELRPLLDAARHAIQPAGSPAGTIAVASAAPPATLVTPNRPLTLGIGVVSAALAGLALALIGQRVPSAPARPGDPGVYRPSSAPSRPPEPLRTPVVPALSLRLIEPGRSAPVPTAAAEEPIRMPPPAALPRVDPPLEPAPVASSALMAYPVAWTLNPGVDISRQPALLSELRQLALPDGFVLLVAAAPHAHAASANLAVALAVGLDHLGDIRVLLVEADFENPSLHEFLNVTPPPQLDFGAQLDARIRGQAESQWHVLKCTDMLHLMPGVPGSADLVLTLQFEASLADLRPYYDLVIVHGPPTSRAVRCHALDEIVDGVLVVSTADDADAERGLAGFSAKKWRRAVMVPAT